MIHPSADFSKGIVGANAQNLPAGGAGTYAQVLGPNPNRLAVIFCFGSGNRFSTTADDTGCFLTGLHTAVAGTSNGSQTVVLRRADVGQLITGAIFRGTAAGVGNLNFTVQEITDTTGEYQGQIRNG